MSSVFHTRTQRLTSITVITVTTITAITLALIFSFTLASPASASSFAHTLTPSATTLVPLSSDPYTNTTSQHQSEVEPDSYSNGSTIVAATQVGRFNDGGSSNIGWATSTDSGATWKSGFLPSTTVFATPAGQYDRVSDPSVAYDAAHKLWMISSLAITNGLGTPNGAAVLVNTSSDGGLTWSAPVVAANANGGFFDKDWIVCDDHIHQPLLWTLLCRVGYHIHWRSGTDEHIQRWRSHLERRSINRGQRHWPRRTTPRSTQRHRNRTILDHKCNHRGLHLDRWRHQLEQQCNDRLPD